MVTGVGQANQELQPLWMQRQVTHRRQYDADAEDNHAPQFDRYVATGQLDIGLGLEPEHRIIRFGFATNRSGIGFVFGA